MIAVMDVRDRFEGGFTAKRSTTRYLVVHHAAALYPQGTGLEDVAAVARYHTQTKGWAGIGYHECLAETVNGGSVAAYTVSDPDLVRAHTAWRNHEAFGLACLTNVDTHPNKLPDEQWIAALVERLRYWRTVYPQAQIVGHREIALPGYATACPGSRWHDWKQELIRRVEAVPTPHRFTVRFNDTWVREAPTVRSRHAWGGTATLPAGYTLEGEIVTGATHTHPALGTSDQWLHWRPAGFVWLPQLATES
jgi:hypothetical protein